MTEYYRIDGQALTYAEYWRMSPGVFGFTIAAFLKLIRCPMSFTFSIPRPDALTFVEQADVPGWVRRRWEHAMDVCQDEGLRRQFFYTVPTLEDYREGYVASFLFPDRLAGAALIAVAHKNKRKTSFSCVSRLPGRQYLITSDQRLQMEQHPDDEVVRLVGALPEDILDRHREEIARPDTRPVPLDPADWPRFVLEREQRHIDYHRVRGVYVRMTEDEVEDILAKQRRRRRVPER